MSAIAEVIERDAFTITWQARLGMPHVRLDSLSFENRDLVDRFERTGHSAHVFNLTLDHGIPTILSVLQSQAPESPAMVFAAAAALNPEDAVRSSLEELAHTRRLAVSLMSTRFPLVPTPDHESIQDQSHHVHLYCNQESAPLARFIFSSERWIDFEEIPNFSTGDPKQDLTICLHRVESIQHRVLLADLTTPEIKDLGLSVVRAVIPGFHPLFMGHVLRALGGRRLWEVPQTLGYEGITRENGDNPFAHPYP